MPRNRYYSGPVSDHFNGRFFNVSPPTRDKGLGDILRWRRTSQPPVWPSTIPVTSVVPPQRSETTRITVVGHATILIQTAGLNLVTDPWWSQRTSPVSFLGPKRVCAPGVAFEDLPRIDAVLLSHNHYDHLDIVTLRDLVARDDPLVMTPLGNDTVVSRSIPAARLWTGDWWDRHDLDLGVGVTIVPAQHWSQRGLGDRRMALWGGFVIQSGASRIYFAGDTGYGDGTVFKAIRNKLGEPDVALLPIGAYAPRWFMSDQHVNPQEAVRMFRDMDARHAIGIHWGVIPLSDEARDEPREALAAALAHHDISPGRFVAAEPGHVWTVGG